MNPQRTTEIVRVRPSYHYTATCGNENRLTVVESVHWLVKNKANLENSLLLLPQKAGGL